ncbi:conserved hypothetical protein, DUF1130 [Bradyrhizobium sp. ORS 375]|uniref:DUF488 domain-containing protein n=1 Tax=Bradyrhizobium sp. (strain ORS 375) TaxID=566679 RepID=UPI0002407B3F|nr:DUF488 domain-containing protein [Bradyrhizobium sp. ORS 375]CCD96431.1 conserved hypothetical protein, DUF1130 [Bradyrhizobium sp. ORS 375]
MTTLYTIGYEGTDIDRFVATLKSVKVQVLADVRAVPISRKKGFSKTKLRDRLEQEGIRYIHLAPLGDPKPGRDAARAGHLAQFREIYSRHLAQSAPQQSLQELANLVSEQATCLMCFERDPGGCHRLIVANALPTQVTMFHLFGDEPDRYVRNASKLPSSRSGQGAAAAQ